MSGNHKLTLKFEWHFILSHKIATQDVMPLLVLCSFNLWVHFNAIHEDLWVPLTYPVLVEVVTIC
jgi:hypothetical protein